MVPTCAKPDRSNGNDLLQGLEGITAWFTPKYLRWTSFSIQKLPFRSKVTMFSIQLFLMVQRLNHLKTCWNPMFDIPLVWILSPQIPISGVKSCWVISNSPCLSCVSCFMAFIIEPQWATTTSTTSSPSDTRSRCTSQGSTRASNVRVRVRVALHQALGAERRSCSSSGSWDDSR